MTLFPRILPPPLPLFAFFLFGEAFFFPHNFVFGARQSPYTLGVCVFLLLPGPVYAGCVRVPVVGVRRHDFWQEGKMSLGCCLLLFLDEDCA